MRTVVALSAFPKLAGHIVAEVRDVDNVENVRLVARHPIECVVANDTIGRMMINCARQPALASVLESLLGFEGDEFYLRAWPELVGRSFHSIFLEDTLAGAVPIGLRKRNGRILLIPGADEIIDDHDEASAISAHLFQCISATASTQLNGRQVIVIAEDDNTYGPRATPLGPSATAGTRSGARVTELQPRP